MSRITGKRMSAGLALAVAATFALSACSMSGSATTAEPSTEPSEPAMRRGFRCAAGAARPLPCPTASRA